MSCFLQGGFSCATDSVLATAPVVQTESPSAKASAQRQESRWTNWIFVVVLIVGIWILAAVLINPRGEFPLNDDWCYAAAVKALREGEGLKLQGCNSTNIIAQVVWGALFCLPFGFSFTALRISTLTLGVVGVLARYGLLREIDADRETALFGALVLAFNPLYLGLSYTFMPDVPFVAVSVLSFYFLGGKKPESMLSSGGTFLRMRHCYGKTGSRFSSRSV